MTKSAGYVDEYHHSPKRPWTAADSCGQRTVHRALGGPLSVAEIAAKLKRSYGAVQTRASNLRLPPKTKARRRSENPVFSKPPRTNSPRSVSYRASVNAAV